MSFDCHILFFFIFVAGDISESYDDVVIIRQLSNNKAGVSFLFNTFIFKYRYSVFLFYYYSSL